MSKIEPIENDVEASVPTANSSAGVTANSSPSAVGSSMMMIGAIPLVLFVVAVVLAFVGVPAIVGLVLLVLAAVGFFFSWKKATGALSANLNALRDEAFAVANEDLPKMGQALSSGTPLSGTTTTRKSVEFQDAEFGAVASGLSAVLSLIHISEPTRPY